MIQTKQATIATLKNAIRTAKEYLQMVASQNVTRFNGKDAYVTDRQDEIKRHTQELAGLGDVEAQRLLTAAGMSW